MIHEQLVRNIDGAATVLRMEIQADNSALSFHTGYCIDTDLQLHSSLAVCNLNSYPGCRWLQNARLYYCRNIGLMAGHNRDNKYRSGHNLIQKSKTILLWVPSISRGVYMLLPRLKDGTHHIWRRFGTSKMSFKNLIAGGLSAGSTVERCCSGRS